jgi:hypothetical protein
VARAGGQAKSAGQMSGQITVKIARCKGSTLAIAILPSD